MEIENELFDLVQRAQTGDKGALQDIISLITPVIRNARYKLKKDRQDDLEQSIIETIIKRVLTYDLGQTPDFSAFCRQINHLHSRV